MKEAFVYSWRNKDTNRLYIGWHKGSPDDGYVCSSKVLMEEYKKDCSKFERFIIAEGTAEYMSALEAQILKTVNAKDNPEYYNQHNGNGLYHLKQHTAEARGKISKSKIGKKRPDLTKRNLTNNPAHNPNISKKMGRCMRGEANPRFGIQASEETKKKISKSLSGKYVGIQRSEETKRKISEAKKFYWANRKLKHNA